MLSLLAPYYAFALQESLFDASSMPALLTNFLISGTASVVAFYQSLNSLGVASPTGPHA